MLSLCVADQEQVSIVAQSASGSRFRRALDALREVSYPLDGNDVLADVARKKQWRFIPDSSRETCSSMQVASRAGVVSQYITPLVGADGGVIALLQIDLGYVSYDTDLYQTEKTVLESLTQIVSSGLNRISNWEENKIIRGLDQAMNDCLSAETIEQGLQQYLERALEAFGLEKGHVRLAQEERSSLRLVAGIGDYYEETRKNRRDVDFGEVSPTAQAFRDEKVVIINDAPHNKAHQEMCRQREKETGSSTRLREIKSYANVPFKSERGERGTINLISSSIWFFLWFHKNPLRALGDRVGFLVETLRGKEREEFLKEREEFLHKVSPRYSRLQDIDNVRGVLSKEIGWLAETVRAEIASLYLWDDDRKRYVLRAEYGWHSPEWVNAAFYTTEEVWTGTSALAGNPRYIPNLFVHYNKYRQSTHRYTKPAFGKELSEKFTKEAIALQLRIADKRLGVLTFYRRIEEGDESGFITTDTKLLQQGADNFASLISILQANRLEKWRKREHKRRQEVYDATIPNPRAKSDGAAETFERRVCQQVLKSYRAVKARFYEVTSTGEPPQFELRASFRRIPATGHVVEAASEAGERELVKNAIYANRSNEKEMLVERVTLKGKQENDPSRVALAGLVRRACVPLYSAKRLVGVLDLHWSFDPAQADSPDYQHGDGLLRMLGEVIGAAYDRHQTKVQAKQIHLEAETKQREGEVNLRQSEYQTRVAVQATTAYALQHQHELRNNIQEMIIQVTALKSVNQACSDEEKNIIAGLSLAIEEGADTVERMIEVGQKMADANRVRMGLESLILSALEKSASRYVDLKVSITPPQVPRHYFVFVDPNLIEIAFTNLLDNAFKSMKTRERRILTIWAKASSGDVEVMVTIEDTGEGMSEEKKRLIFKDFPKLNGRVRFGVMIAKLILGLHGGRLDYNSTEGDGTKTIVALPLDYMEEEA
jgi:signal transduction histidine kinase